MELAKIKMLSGTPVDRGDLGRGAPTCWGERDGRLEAAALLAAHNSKQFQIPMASPTCPQVSPQLQLSHCPTAMMTPGGAPCSNHRADHSPRQEGQGGIPFDLCRRETLTTRSCRVERDASEDPGSPPKLECSQMKPHS